MKKLERKKGVYWEVDENGETVGDPYCPVCFEDKDETQVRLITVNEPFQSKKCPKCDFRITFKKIN